MADALPHAPEPVLRVRGLGVGYKGNALLPPLTFDLYPRQFWVIVGRNGSGKSTLLRSLVGLLPPVSGTLTWLSGVSIGYIPQRADIDLTVPTRVIDLVRQGCERGWSFARPRWVQGRRESIAAAMHEAGIVNLATRAFGELSEGQKQRVLLARALVSDPAILVLDEPTSAMDLQSERDIFDLLERLQAARGLCIVVVGHHLPALAHRATHLAVVDGDDKLAELGELRRVAVLPSVVERYGRLFTDAITDPMKDR